MKIVFQHLFFCNAFLFESILQGNKWPMCCSACSIVISILPNMETFKKKTRATFFPSMEVAFKQPFLFPLLLMTIAELCVVKLFCRSFNCGCEAAGRLSVSHNSTAKTPEYPFINRPYLPTIPATITSVWQQCRF